MLCGRRVIQAKSGGAVQVDNPASGEIIGSVPKLGAAETRGAIEAADRASPLGAKRRARNAPWCSGDGST